MCVSCICLFILQALTSVPFLILLVQELAVVCDCGTRLTVLFTFIHLPINALCCRLVLTIYHSLNLYSIQFDCYVVSVLYVCSRLQLYA